MQERGITDAEVQYCLKNYHTSYPDRLGNTIYKVDLESGKGIKVVVKAQSANPMIVITVADY